MASGLNSLYSGMGTQEYEGENKVLELREAVSRYVRPGMTLYVREGSNGAIRQVIRQFQGSNPRFNLIVLSCRDYALDLVYCGLVDRIITSRCSEGYNQGPSPITQRAYQQKSVAIENWSILSLTLRLMAGAMGLGFMPTKSIHGSSMAIDNEDSFREVDNPFVQGERIGVVKSLNPDLAIVHGWASDPDGNLIVASPILSGEGEWGAFGSKNGVIATVEKIVSTEFIREHSSLVKIPGHFVKSVSVLPFGSHPMELATVAGGEFEGYEADYEFMEKHYQASKADATLDAWLKEWVIECPDHEEYLRKLGKDRLYFLQGKASGLDLERKLRWVSGDRVQAAEYSATEMMIVAASRIITEKALNEGYRLIVAGIGPAILAAWLAYYGLRQKGYHAELMIGTGIYGYAPNIGDSRLTNLCRVMRTCKMNTDVIHSYGVFIGGEGNRCVSVLGTGQIDKSGNMNSTRLSDSFYMTGSGGANDAANAEEVVVMIPQSTRRFTTQLPYITCSGVRVKTVVSDKGVFKKDDISNELILAGYFAQPDALEEAEAVRKIKENCAWELKVHQSVGKIDPPSSDELAALRLLDADSG